MKFIDNNKGFTLAELLVVVAIICVLVAVAIPTIGGKMEKSREAVDIANVRSAYAAVSLAALTDDTSTDRTDGVVYADGHWSKNVDLTQQKVGWQGITTPEIGGITPADATHWHGSPAPNNKCLVSYTQENGMSIAWGYNFGPIANTMATKDGKTPYVLFTAEAYPMLESSGGTGQELTNEIKKLLGLQNAANFSYKLIPIKKGKEIVSYEAYVSTTYTLRSKQTKNQSSAGKIEVVGYKFVMTGHDTCEITVQGTPQTINIYTNKDGQEKMDVYGDQNTGKPPTQEPYSWDGAHKFK